MSGAAGPPRTAAVAAGCAAGAIALLLYTLTASRYVASHDAAEFQTLARTGGIAHAGYPVLVMLLEGLGRLPFSTLPMRANMLSAISGAIVVGLAAWSGTRLAGRAAAGLVAALGLALSITFWKESTHAGVHVFTLVLAAIAFHLAMRCAGRPSGRDAFLLGLTVGTGLLSHLTILALGPVLIVALVRAARARLLRVPHVAAAALGLAIGLSGVAYLIAHDRPDQPMNYIQDTLRPDNADELSGGNPPRGRIERAAWLLSARQFLGGYVFSPFSDSPRRLRDLVLDGLLNDLPLWGWPIALYGAWVLVRRHDPAAPWLGLWMAGALFCLLYAARPGMGPIFFLPGLWILSQLVAVALGAFAHRSRAALALAGGLIVLTPLARLAIAEPPGPVARASALRLLWEVAPEQWSPYHADATWDTYGRAVMRALPPRAIVLSCWDEATTLRYFRHAEVLRDDVDVLYHCRMPRPAFAAADSAGRPVFTTYPLTLEMTGGRAFTEVGRWARGGLWRIEGPP